MSELTNLQFVQKVYECFKEYKKQLGDTNDDGDAAFYFNETLRTFLIKHKQEIDVLSNMNFERHFIAWVRKYIYKVPSKR